MKYFSSINCNNLEDKVKLFEGQNDKIIKKNERIRNESHLLKILNLKQKNSILKCQDKMTQ